MLFQKKEKELTTTQKDQVRHIIAEAVGEAKRVYRFRAQHPCCTFPVTSAAQEIVSLIEDLSLGYKE